MYLDIARPDTGWDCCVCSNYATVMGDGFTWCLKHWEKWALGEGEDIKSMRKNLGDYEKQSKKVRLNKYD